MPKEKSCGTIVFHLFPKVMYLLLQYGARHWDFPKGHVEAGENEEETARRELQEETGIHKASLIPSFRETIKYFYTKGGQRISKEVVFFLMEASETEVLLSSEHIGFVWLPYKDAMERLTFRNARDILRKANRIIAQKESQ